MSSIVKHLLPYSELKKEIENNPEILNSYIKYDSFIGEAESVDYIINKLYKTDKKSKTLTKKYDK
jgi:hypothetical protein